jgi:DUF1680 family protein
MNTSKTIRSAVAGVLLGLVAISCAAEPASPTVALEPVCFQKIKLGGFWKQQAKRMTEKWLPHCIRQMEKGGRGQELLNLVETAKVLRGVPHGTYTGAPWSDAYVYNTVEAICLALAIDPAGDAELAKAQGFLRDKIEAWIPIILAAQMEDGYIHSFHCVKQLPHYSNIANHEFYVMGYFIEMGIAHYQITGGQDRRLYDAARKCADQLCRVFGPAPKRTWKNGHPGLEYALCRLARMVNKVEGAGHGDKYLQLAKHLLDHQHELEPNPYNQSHVPAVKMDTAVGHAVRGTYFYTAMADIALLTGDRAYQHAVDKIWANAIHRKHYLTGGVGASHGGEAFGEDFDLHNDGYCESCAGCGLSFWSDRMHRLHREAHYRDVQERVLYNNLLGAVELSGENFFYQNPLQSAAARYPWHGCPCCVGNIPRALLAIKDLMYSTNGRKDVLYLSHFVDSEGTISDIGGAALRIRQETEYPWKGEVRLMLHPSAPADFLLRIRIPDRTESELYTATPALDGRFTLTVNGQRESPPVEHGYVGLRRSWKDGDRVELSLPLEVQRVHCDERVAANRGRVALQRGPLVYSVEDVDVPRPARSLVLPPDLPLQAVWRPDRLGGIMAIEGPGITAVPNFVRLNRGGASLVWIAEDAEKAGLNTIASRAAVSVSFHRPGMDPTVVGAPTQGRNFDFWPHKGGQEWIQYEFDSPTKVSEVTVRWFDDTGRGQCRIPSSWRLLYRAEDGTWKPADGVSAYGVAKDQPNRTTFNPVSTRMLRIELTLQPNWSAGLWRWDVK